MCRLFRAKEEDKKKNRQRKHSSRCRLSRAVMRSALLFLLLVLVVLTQILLSFYRNKLKTMRKEKKEEKTSTKLSYAKGLSHAVLKYLEKEETKAFMEKIEKNEEEEEEEEEEDEKSIVVAPRVEDVPKDFERKEKEKKTKEEEKEEVLGVGTPSLNSDGSGEKKKKTMKRKEKKTETPKMSSSPSKETAEEAGNSSRFRSAFDLIQLQIIDPAEELLRTGGKKENDDGDVRDSPRESSQRRDVLSADGSARGTPVTKSFVEAGTTPMKQQRERQEQQTLVRMDKGINTEPGPQRGGKKIMLKAMPREIRRSQSFTKRKQQVRPEVEIVEKHEALLQVIEATETGQKTTTTGTEIRPPIRSDSFKKRRRESIKNQLLQSAKASMAENMRSMSQPDLVQYQRRECEEKQPQMRTSLCFEDFLENALIGTTDVTGATGGSGNDNNNANNPHSPRSESFKNIASFWKQCEGEEGRNEGDSGEKMDITTNAQSPHQPHGRQKFCDCKECVAALMEHAAKVGRYVVAQEDEEKRQRAIEQQQKKTANRQQTTAEAVVATNITSAMTTSATTTSTPPLHPNFQMPPPLLLASAGITGGTFDIAANPLLTTKTTKTSSLSPTLYIHNTNKCALSPGALLVDSFVMSPLLDQLDDLKQ